MSVLKFFEERTVLHPDAIAVSFAGRRVTYAQLNDRANQIAFALHTAGVVSGSLVVLYLERSSELIAAMLGVWKAGGAYLPIDSTHPLQRIAYTLDDSQAEFILTETALVGALPATPATKLLIEAIHPQTADEGTFAGVESPRPDQLAYVIYTSGSTGKPKGAEVCHGGLLNVIQGTGKDLALAPSEVTLAHASIAFDISNEEIFVPLLAGACVQVLEREFVGDGQKLIDVMRRCNATLVFGTPTLWRLVLEAGWQGNPKLQIVVGGEVLPLSLARTLAGMTRSLWNHYGPTETSICATRERILPDAEEVTLGWPLDNVKIYILNDQLEHIVVGEVGEIYIAGVGVGRGYLNRPDLTARVFLPDCFDDRPGARMYKTGDLGRLLPDGRLDFHGRVDNQIKLRGYRIELEEIEAAIREYRGVHAAIVQVVEYGPEDQRLIAYFLSDELVTAPQLRDFLRDRLPFYMLPSELIALDSLPMTINGKIDRAALDAIRLKIEAEAEMTEPAGDDLEERLRAIWRKLLKVRSVGVSDNFFELGGHSLLAARMFAEVRKLTGRKILLSVLVQNPTVLELATYIRSQPEDNWPGLVPIQERGSLPPLFIAHGLGSSLLLFRELTEDLGPNQPVYGIQLAANNTAHLEELTLESMAARYVEDILAVDPIGPYALAGHSLGGLMVFEIASQLRSRGKEIGLLGLLDCNFHVAHRDEDLPEEVDVPLSNAVGYWKSKLARFFQGDMTDMVRRKILYNKLMFQIWLLRKIHKEGTYYPHLFGVDPYIALFAERYQARPMYQDATLFVAEDQLAPEALGLGWSEVVRGHLEIQKIPGTHQTMFTHPHVAVLAQELAKRLDLAARPVLAQRS